jgi:glycosyltransferase involved in cell wall biosynthesis
VERVAGARPAVRPLVLGDPEIPHTETPWFYAAADVLLLTSDSEGSPNVIREAMAMGLPIASVDVGDVREAIGASRFARVIASHEPEQLAPAVIELLDQGGRSDGRASAERRSIESTAQRYLEIYDRVAGGARRASA